MADPNALLCRRCGYVIDGLSSNETCPECGADIAGSLPSARTGAAWQRGPELRSWARGCVRAIRHPLVTFDKLAIERSHSARHLTITLHAAAGMPIVVLIAMLIASTINEVVNGASTFAQAWTAAMLFAALGFVYVVMVAFLYLLVWIETQGMRFWGRRRGYRISKSIAISICANASAGWLVGSAALSILLAVVLTLFSAGVIQYTALSLSPLGARFWMAMAGCVLLGLMFFKTLVYIGVLQCRYANEPRTDST